MDRYKLLGVFYLDEWSHSENNFDFVILLFLVARGKRLFFVLHQSIYMLIRYSH